MREYGKVAPTFWTGDTGKEIRKGGSEGVIVALYLMSSPHSNMLGLYYQPLLYMAHETGLGIEGASKGLRICIEAGFCDFDEATEMVWVYEMAAFQIANELKAADRRCIGIQKDYDLLPKCSFLGPFFDRYSAAFHLKKRRSHEGATQPPSKPLRSQEQEQEQEQEQDKTEGTVITGGITPREGGDDPTIPKDAAEWARYFRDRHGVELNPSSKHDRTKAWPLFTAWTNAGVTIGLMERAIAKARSEADGVIAFLPAYVDRVLASMTAPAPPPRQSPEERRRAISRANGEAWLAESPESDPNVIDMEH